jgi:hypothetical protein
VPQPGPTAEDLKFESLTRSQASHYNKEGDLKFILRLSSAHQLADDFARTAIPDAVRPGQPESNSYPAQTEGLGRVSRNFGQKISVEEIK